MTRRNPFFLKTYFLVALLAVSLASFLYMQDIIFKLEETSLMQSRIFARFTTNLLSENSSANTEDIIFEEIIKNIKFPIVVTDSLSVPITWRNIGYMDTVFSDKLSQKDRVELERIINRLDNEKKPLEMKYNDRIFAVIHLGEDPLYKRLQFAPFFQIIVSSIFILIGIYGFLFYKKSEDNIIWAGMAKETAHQIGTPLTSLRTWAHLLKDKNIEKNISEGIEEDILRLEIISTRFNKIGSPLTIELIDIKEEIADIIQYFQKRTPQTGKHKIDLSFSNFGKCPVPVDKDLFKWAVENLIKNSIDALKNVNDGFIKITLSSDQNRVMIRVSDNGAGIEKKNLEKIFEIGFSTKKYGWGIGLPLTKKIIEEFHFGKLVLEQTMLNSGTTFVITLPKNAKKDEKKNSVD